MLRFWSAAPNRRVHLVGAGELGEQLRQLLRGGVTDGGYTNCRPNRHRSQTLNR